MLHSIDFELIRASDFVKQNENYKAEIIYNKILEKFPKNIRASDALKSLEKNTSKIKSSYNQMQAIKECFNNNQKDKALKLALDLEKKDNSIAVEIKTQNTSSQNQILKNFPFSRTRFSKYSRGIASFRF